MKKALMCCTVFALFLFSCGDNSVNPNSSDTYTLTVQAAPAVGGTVGRNPERTSHASGSSVTLTAVPATGYVFERWSGAGLTSTTLNPTTIIMSEDRMVTAHFLATYTLTVQASPTAGGTVDISPRQTSYPAGTVVTLTARPASGYALDRWTWTGGGTLNSTGANTATITMNANRTVTANFSRTANAVIITLTYWETTVTDPGGPDPRIHFRVVAVQGSREVSSNNTSALLDAQDIGQTWSGSRRSSAIPFIEQADELRIYAVVVEKDLLFNDDISPGHFGRFTLPRSSNDTGTMTLE